MSCSLQDLWKRIGSTALRVALASALVGLAAAPAAAVDDEGWNTMAAGAEPDDESWDVELDSDEIAQHLEGAWLGVALDMGDGDTGVRVQQVYDGSPAESAGLKDGDVIVSVDGKSTSDVSTLTKIIRERKPGDKIAIRIVRDGHEQSLNATLGKREARRMIVRVPDSGEIQATIENALGGVTAFDWSASRVWMGVSMTELTPELRRHFGAPEDNGTLVAEVRPGSPAEKAGVKVGDILTEVDGEKVGQSFDVSRAIRERNPGDTVNVSLVRDGQTRTVNLTLAERPADATRRLEWKGPMKGRALHVGPPNARTTAELKARMKALQAELEDLTRRLDEMTERLKTPEADDKN